MRRFHCLALVLMLAAGTAAADNASMKESGRQFWYLSSVGGDPAPQSDDVKISQKRLGWPISLSFKDTPLRQVLDDLHLVTGLNIVADEAALRDAGIDLDTPLSLNVENISVKSALHLLLKEAHLGYVIRDEVIDVTTEENARPLKQVSYPVADLVVPIGDRTAFLLEGTEEGKQFAATPEGQKATVKACAVKLMALLKVTIDPQSWCDSGGAGTIRYDSDNMGLIVDQYQDVQEQVMEMLCALRLLQNEAYKEYTMQVSMRSRKGNDMTMPKITFVREQFISLCVQTRCVVLAGGPVEEGVYLEGKLKNDLTLDLTFRQPKIEQNDDARLIVNTSSHRLVQKTEPGKPVQLVLERNQRGRPERWLEIVIQEARQETAAAPPAREQ